MQEDTTTKPRNREWLALEVTHNPEFKFSHEKAQEIEAYLETSDELLKRLEPFDENTYSYLQIMYSTNANRYALNRGLKFNLDDAEEYLLAAMAIPEGYLSVESSNDRVRIEVVGLKIQHAFLLSNRDRLFGENNADRICGIIQEGDDLNKADFYSSLDSGWVEAYRDRIEDLKQQNQCI